MVKKELEGVIELSSSPEEVGVWGHNNSKLISRRFEVAKEEDEEEEDCFILEFDPNASLSNLSISNNNPSPPPPPPDELCVLAVKGPVACRDYPHSRHLCANNPFDQTPHESYCQLCFCFVCDIAAPCKHWFGSEGHCHATDDDQDCKLHRTLLRKLKQRN